MQCGGLCFAAAVEALTGDARKAALQLAQQTQWRNKAVSDLYEPGSVFKLITCAAALDAGAITKHSSFYCGESISVAGTRFHCANHKRHGAQSVTQALENSCNQSFIQIGARLGREAFCDYFAAFGLREPTGIDLPAEPKKSLYYTADRMGPVELASCAFGQSSKISYLEMAAAVCAVVNGGKLMQPYVVSEILAPDGSTIEQLAPVCKRQVLKAETSQTMREMMEAVVLHGGGRNAQIPGYRVGGKSGTSQKLDSTDAKSPHCQLCGGGSHRRPAVSLPGLPGRTPQLDDRRRQPVGPGLCRSAGADAGVQGRAPHHGSPGCLHSRDCRRPPR